MRLCQGIYIWRKSINWRSSRTVYFLNEMDLVTGSGVDLLHIVSGIVSPLTTKNGGPYRSNPSRCTITTVPPLGSLLGRYGPASLMTTN